MKRRLETERFSGDGAASTADRLLVGAAKLFRSKGYTATTTRELSALLGIQNASLYHHMEKKEDLLFNLCVAALKDVSNVLQAAIDETSDPLDRLKSMIIRYMKLALLERDEHATMLIEIRALSSDRREHILKLRDSNVAIVREAMLAAQKQGVIRSDISAKYLTLALFNLLNWSIFWYSPEGVMTATQVANLLCKLFLEGATMPNDNRVKRQEAAGRRPARSRDRKAEHQSH
jgi:AcrR family transcriptional regulator